MKKGIFISAVLICFFLSTGLFAVDPADAPVIVRKCTDFKISGGGTSEKWKGAEWIDLLRQGSGLTVYKTRVKLLYSETGIYFLFNCEDKKLTSTMKADNLHLWEEDVVEVFLWTDESFPVYFEYELSPLNFELPIIVPNDKGNFFGWLPWQYEGDRKTQHATSTEGGMKKSGGSVTGWKAEFYIPYKLLVPLNHVPPVSGTKWRANMYRIDYDNGETQFAWKKTSKTFHEFNNFGTIIFE